MMLQDMHLHTNFSDGANTLQEMAEAAVDCGLHEICFTDHVWKESDWWPEYFTECQRVAQSFLPNLNISCGVEAKVCDFSGTLDLPLSIDRKILQVAAIHRLPIGNRQFLRKDLLRQNGSFAVTCWKNTLSGLNKNPSISSIAHPFSLLPYMDITLDESFWNQVVHIFDKGSYLIEYNTKYDNSFIPLSFWKHFSPRIIFGSDSHSVEDLQKSCHTTIPYGLT